MDFIVDEGDLSLPVKEIGAVIELALPADQHIDADVNPLARSNFGRLLEHFLCPGQCCQQLLRIGKAAGVGIFRQHHQTARLCLLRLRQQKGRDLLVRFISCIIFGLDDRQLHFLHLPLLILHHNTHFGNMQVSPPKKGGDTGYINAWPISPGVPACRFPKCRTLLFRRVLPACPGRCGDRCANGRCRYCHLHCA